MTSTWWKRFLVIVFLWIIVLTIIHFVSIREYFTGMNGAPWNYETLDETNQGQSPWLHYPIHQSNISDPVIKYPTAHYYEMSNQEYESALQKTFSMKNCDQLSMALQAKEWSGKTNPSDIQGTQWTGVYDQWLVEFKKQLLASPFLKLPADSTEIQIVHDRWISAYTHVSDPTLLRMDTEVILYRLGKPYGKHVSMSVIAKRKEPDGIFATTNDWYFTTVAIEVLGVIPEDQIALFPVVANNPFDPEQMAYKEDPSTFSTPIVPPAEEVLNGIQRHVAQYDAISKTNNKLKLMA